jgi:hypothetical protein
LFLGEVLELLDELTGLHSPLVERAWMASTRFSDGSGGLMDVAMIGHLRHSQGLRMSDRV